MLAGSTQRGLARRRHGVADRSPPPQPPPQPEPPSPSLLPESPSSRCCQPMWLAQKSPRSYLPQPCPSPCSQAGSGSHWRYPAHRRSQTAAAVAGVFRVDALACRRPVARRADARPVPRSAGHRFRRGVVQGSGERGRKRQYWRVNRMNSCHASSTACDAASPPCCSRHRCRWRKYSRAGRQNLLALLEVSSGRFPAGGRQASTVRKASMKRHGPFGAHAARTDSR